MWQKWKSTLRDSETLIIVSATLVCKPARMRLLIGYLQRFSGLSRNLDDEGWALIFDPVNRTDLNGFVTLNSLIQHHSAQESSRLRESHFQLTTTTVADICKSFRARRLNF
jgi:hypothetical protein